MNRLDSKDSYEGARTLSVNDKPVRELFSRKGVRNNEGKLLALGFVLEAHEEWLVTAPGLTDKLRKELIAEKRTEALAVANRKAANTKKWAKVNANSFASADGKVNTKTFANTGAKVPTGWVNRAHYERVRDEREVVYRAALKNLPMKALENPAYFWTCEEQWVENSRALFWKDVSNTLPSEKFRFGKLCESVVYMCAQYNLNKVKQAGFKTTHMKHQWINQFAKDLHELGYLVTTPCHLTKKHMVSYIRAMEDGRVMRDGVPAAPKTLQTAHSNISALYRWVGRSSEIVRLLDCVADVSSVRIDITAKPDETPEGKGVNSLEMIEGFIRTQHDEKLFMFGWMLGTMEHFGLRLQEVLKLRPCLDIAKDFSFVDVLQGKGGRARRVSLETNMQRGFAQRLVEAMPLMFGKNFKDHYLGPDNKTDNSLNANMRWFWRVCDQQGLTKAKLGVTGHKFRAEFAVQLLREKGVAMLINEPRFDRSKYLAMYDLLLGVKLADESEANGGKHLDRVMTPEEESEFLLSVSEALGHGRKVVLLSYAPVKSLIPKNTGKRISASQEASFVQSYNEGMSIEDLQIKFGISKDTVYRKARSHGLPPPSSRGFLDSSQTA